MKYQLQYLLYNFKIIVFYDICLSYTHIAVKWDQKQRSIQKLIKLNLEVTYFITIGQLIKCPYRPFRTQPDSSSLVSIITFSIFFF